MKKTVMFYLCFVLLLNSQFKKNKNTNEDDSVSDKKILKVLEQQGDIIIGCNLPYTGPYASQGIDELRAYKMAIDELNNKGGILGKKVGYVIKDTRSKPDIVVQNATELIEKHKAIIITGGVSSGVAVAVSELCQKKKVIFMATVTHSDATTGKKAYRYMFRKCTSATMDGRALSTILSKYYSKNNNYSYITADYTWGWTTEEAISGIIATVPWAWQLQDLFKNAKIFNNNYYKRYKKYPSNVSESAYINIVQYARAVERTKSFNAKKVIHSLEGREFTGLKDKERWRKFDHQCIQTVFLVKGKKVKNMTNKYDLYDIIYRVNGEKIAGHTRKTT